MGGLSDLFSLLADNISHRHSVFFFFGACCFANSPRHSLSKHEELFNSRVGSGPQRCTGCYCPAMQGLQAR